MESTTGSRGIYKYDSLNRMSEAVMEDGRYGMEKEIMYVKQVYRKN
ncbi:MAG: hypothetical protein HDT39_06220 [Lachnospiraceae bacterium]|nr:hypothetical protein [Lachnospiraceae bacterium]